MFFIGQTRFSLFVPDSASWRLSLVHRDEALSSYRAELYDDNRLRVRENIFLNHSLPNIAVAAEKYDITHVVSYSESLPEPYKESLARAADMYPFLLLDEQPDGEVGRSLNGIAKQKAEVGENFGIYRLDDDDVLATNYFHRMDKFIRPSYTGMVVSFPLGIEAVLDEGQAFNLKAAHFPMNSMGLMSVCRMNNRGRIIAPKNGAHNKADRDNAVILDSREFAYFRFNHVDQDNVLRLSEGASLASIKKMMARYPDFEDFEILEELFPTIPQLLGTEEEIELVTQAQKVRLPFTIQLEELLASTTVEIKHQFDATSKERQALVSLEIVDQDGRPVDTDREFPGIGRSQKGSIGYYKYLNSLAGSESTRFDVTLPGGFFLKAITVKRFGLRSKPFVVSSVSIRRLSDRSSQTKHT